MFDVWPTCAKDGCPFPALVKIEQQDENGPIWAVVCPLCALEARQILDEMAAIREERRRLLQAPRELLDE